MAQNLIEDIKNKLNAKDIIEYFNAKNINSRWEFLKNHSKKNPQNLSNNFYQLIAHTEKFFELIRKKDLNIKEAQNIFKKMIKCANLLTKFNPSLIAEAGFVFERKYKNQLINCISIFQFFTLNVSHVTEDFSFSKTLNNIPLTYIISLIEPYSTKIIAGILIGKMKNCSASIEDIFISIISQYLTVQKKEKKYIKEIHDIFKFAILNARKIFYDTECSIILSFLEYLSHNPKITRYLAAKEFDHKFEDYQFSPITRVPKLENAAQLKSHEISINHRQNNKKISDSHIIDNIISITSNKKTSKTVNKVNNKLKNNNIDINTTLIAKQVKAIEFKIKFAFMISDIDIVAQPLQKFFNLIDIEEKESISTIHEKYNAIGRIVRRIINFDGPVAQKVAFQINLEEEIEKNSYSGYIPDSAEILEDFIEKRFEKLDRYVKNLLINE